MGVKTFVASKNRIRILTLFILPALSLIHPVHSASNVVFNPPRQMTVRKSVADVRAKPTPHNKKYEYDPLQETQVLKGELVLVYERKDDWYRVECPEQMEFTHNSKWEGYPGWIPAGALSRDVSSYRPPIRIDMDEADLRSKILAAAARHLGAPYLWGGRSLYDPKNRDAITGVDCSGLVNWSYRQANWLIPRDAHEQFLKSKRIEPAALKQADLVFLANVSNPEKVVHVLICAEKGFLIEAPQSGGVVRRIAVSERFGQPLESLKNGAQVQDRIVYFGTFFGGTND